MKLPLSIDASLLLTFIKETPPIRGYQLMEILGIDITRVMAAVVELYDRNLIRMKFGPLQGNLAKDYELAEFYPF